jgi:hypothetical protein
MKQNITKKGLFTIAAKTIDEKRPEVVALMQRYGMDVTINDSSEKIDAAFLALIRTSRGFRKEFSAVSVPVAEQIKKEYSNMSGHLNVTGVAGRGIGSSTTTEDAFKPTGTIVTRNRPAKVPTDMKRSGFGQWVSGVFDKDTMQNIINTGLGIWAYQKTGGGVVGQTGGSVLDDARDDYDKDKDKDNDRNDDGLGLGAIIGISLVGIALVGGVIYAVTKK